MQKHHNLSPGVFVLVLTQITVVHFMPKMTPPPLQYASIYSFCSFFAFTLSLFACNIAPLAFIFHFVLTFSFFPSPDSTRQQLRFQHFVKLSPV